MAALCLRAQFLAAGGIVSRAVAALPAPPVAAWRGAAPPQSLVEALDSLLNTGVVLDGQIVLCIAGVDLVHIGLRALLASTDTAARLFAGPTPRVAP